MMRTRHEQRVFSDYPRHRGRLRRWNGRAPRLELKRSPRGGIPVAGTFLVRPFGIAPVVIGSREPVSYTDYAEQRSEPPC